MRVRPRSILVFALLVLLLPAAGADVGAHFTRHVDRLVASPTPVGGLVVLGDAASYRVEVPEGVVVCVDATESGAAPFTLRASDGARTLASPVPTLAQSLLLPGPSTWTLQVDPAFGAEAHITLDLAGSFVDCGRTSAAFGLVDMDASSACLTEAGACLP